MLRGTGLIVALAFRALPERLRFRAAIVVARWLEPLIALTRGYQERTRLRTDDLRETSLELLLMMLTRHRTTFDPVLHVDGIEHLPAAGSGPNLIVGPHTMLSTLFIRHLDDAGHDPVVITADPDQGVPGRRTRARVVCPSPVLLFRVRRYLEEGNTVAGMIDRRETERHSATVKTSGGPVFVSDALLQLAVRHGARIVFIATNLDDASRIVIRLASPSHGSHDVHDIVTDFADFVAGMS
jgi:lauroyl/myristoyl acyltransferase